MRRRVGIIFMLLGEVLVAAAIALIIYNNWDNNRAGNSAQSVLDALQEEIKDRAGNAESTGSSTGSDTEDSADSQDTEVFIYSQSKTEEMDTISIDGYEYIGTLAIPSLDLELPIMSEWSYPGLKIAPGRYTGSVWTDNLVICGHNYERHFGNLKYLEAGDRIYFTDVNGNVFCYEVEEVIILQPTDIEEMIESDWDLTLFTCTIGGRTRVTVRCMRVDVE